MTRSRSLETMPRRPVPNGIVHGRRIPRARPSHIECSPPSSPSHNGLRHCIRGWQNASAMGMGRETQHPFGPTRRMATETKTLVTAVGIMATVTVSTCVSPLVNGWHPPCQHGDGFSHLWRTVSSPDTDTSSGNSPDTTNHVTIAAHSQPSKECAPTCHMILNRLR
jgi:hypothetical protein